MTVLVKLTNGGSYAIDNVVSVNKIVGTVLIQYIGKDNTVQTVTYDDTCNVQLSAIIM